jgi:hypothetical protein
MERKPNRVLQIGTLVFALSMFATYMVYSQLQRTRYVTDSSSAKTNQFTQHSPVIIHKTNQAKQQQQIVIAPSSKVKAPLFEMPTPAAKQRAPAGLPDFYSKMVAPGSKSAAVFDLSSRQQAPELPEFHSKMVAPGSKSAPVFDVQQQQAVKAAQKVGTASRAPRMTNAPPTSHSPTH